MNPFRSKQCFHAFEYCVRPAFQSLRSAAGGIALCGCLVLSGCMGFQISTQKNNLSESGFLARMPQTPKQHEAYAALPSYVLLRGVAGGGAYYVYKDDRTGAVYIGGEADYERYLARVRKLVAYFETTEAKMAARDMDPSLQRLWYSSWAGLIRLDPPRPKPSPAPPAAGPSLPPRRFDFADPWSGSLQ
jgi:hypothetical protein